MKNVLLFITIFLLSITGYAQETIAKVEPTNLNAQQLKAASTVAVTAVSEEIMLNHTHQAQVQLTEFAINNIEYPEAIETSGLEGQIIIDVWINQEGKIINTKIIESFNDNFNGVVIEALQNFELSKHQKISYLGARRLRVPIDFIME